MIPGELIVNEGEITCNEGHSVISLKVINTGDRPVQVGSHSHFFGINRQMLFDRPEAFGLRLNIPAGTSVRFEPGEEKEVELTTLAGAQRVFGLNNLVDGDTKSDESKQAAVERMKNENFKTESS
jgi:urease beta subunit